MIEAMEILAWMALGVLVGTLAGLILLTTGLWVVLNWPRRWGG
jgi:hypothetical protein